MDPEELNYVLTRLGPIASGGRVEQMSNPSNLLSTLRINVDAPVSVAVCDCEKLKEKNFALKQALREHEWLDEIVQPSKNYESAYELTETEIEVKNGRYEIAVPFKLDELKNLANHFDSALKRTLLLRKTAEHNPELKETLTGTFDELINEKWIEPVDVNVELDRPMWYLPFFVTKSAKPRVVYDGSCVVSGMSLNQVALSGENLLNNLVEVLTRFRLGKFACVADLSKCFFQVQIPPDQRDLFRLIWFKDNEMSNEVQIFRFTRHVWGINSSPFIALLAIKRLVSENPTHAGEATLHAMLNNRYMDDMLFACNSFEKLRAIAFEGIKFFGSRGFRLRKWVANRHSINILTNIPHCDLVTCFTEVDLGSNPLPNSETLGLRWDPQNDVLRVNCKEFTPATTRREMASQLASQFDPLGMASPYFFVGKLILQRVVASGVEWDETISPDIQNCWKKWLGYSDLFQQYYISRSCLPDNGCDHVAADYQLHGFCDASNSAFCCVVYLRRLADGKPVVNFILGKSKLVLTHQANWVISRKELEAAKL